MFQVKKALSNARPEKNDSPEVITTTTKGTMKITSTAATAIGVGEGDYLNVVKAGEEGQEDIYLSKGSKGNGNKLLDAGAGFSVSSANVWDQLGGNVKNKKVYSVQLENPEEDANGVKYYKLVHTRDESKANRRELNEEEKAAQTEKRKATLEAKKAKKAAEAHTAE